MFKVKQAEKEKSVVENMKGIDGELEMLLSEIPRMTSWDHHLNLNLLNNHHLFITVSPSSSSFSSGLSSSNDDLSPYVAQMNQSVYRKASTHCLDELGLHGNLSRMNITEAYKDYPNVRRFRLDPDGLGFNGCSLDGTTPCNFDNYGTCDGFSSGLGIPSIIPGNSMGSNGDMKPRLPGFSQGYNAGNLMGSRLTHNQSNAFNSEPNGIEYDFDRRKLQGRSSCNGGFQLNNPSANGPYLTDEVCCLQRNEAEDIIGDKCILNSVSSSQFLYPNLNFRMGNSICNSSMSKEETRAIPNGRVPPSLLSMTDAGDFEAFTCEDSFIIQGKSLNYVVEKEFDRLDGRKKKSHDKIAVQNERHDQSQLKGIFGYNLSPKSCCSLSLNPTFSSLAQMQGYIYFMSKNQPGCRFLQRIFDEGNRQDVQMIFNGIVNHVVELMTNSFGNYLVQKLLEVCSEEQRMQIVLMLTEEPGDLVRISLNTHGTRVVQKLIETLKTRQEISLVTLALKPGFLDLIMDLNGNHVIQRCLQCLSKEDNKFIFDAAAKFCVKIATHQHGCCVLNRCIARSAGKYHEKLVAEIAARGLYLAQDSFGNYVIQYILELKVPSATASLISQFKGHYVYLSTQKYSSHVVEKCLKYCEESRPQIISELLLVPHFEQLLQDPFANYVIQSALEVSKGTLHASLLKAVRPHAILRTSPYCKKIFSRNLLK